MIISYDYFNQIEKPNLTLCNPDKSQLYSLGACYNTEFIYRYNALSELSFKYPQSTDGGITTLAPYDYIKPKRLILLKNIGYFVIISNTEDTSGAIPTRNVHCVSIDGELMYKRLTAFSGTYALYNIVSPENTLLGKIVAMIPGWAVGTVDISLYTKFRTFNINDSTIYSFLVTDVEQTYGCVIIFDYTNKTISAKTIENATSASDVVLTFDNLLKSCSVKEISEEITTCLHVYGGDGLDIHAVNPLGNNKIYDFSYFTTTSWMSQSLIDQIGVWEDAVDTQQPTYAGYLTDLKNANNDLLLHQGELAVEQAEYLRYEGIQKVRIEAGLNYSDILEAMEGVLANIAATQLLISDAEGTIASLQASLDAIVTYLDFDSWFTAYPEIYSFIFENTFQNENIIKTDIMTNAEIQDESQKLYDQAVEILARISQPRYEISIDSINFFAIKDYQHYTTDINLGSVVRVYPRDDYYVDVVLLEINQNLDDPTKFSFTFSNRLRLDNGKFIYSDLFGQTVKSGTNVKFDAGNWSNWEEYHKTDVVTFIDSALDTSLNNLINSTNEEILINQNGLKGKSYDHDTQTYSDTQVWLTSNTLAFTKDAWTSAALALGQITVGETTTFGLVAQTIVGELVASSELIVSTESGQFTMDGNGAVLSNATLSVENTVNKILLDPTSGFKIQNGGTGNWADTFSLDVSGNVVMSNTSSTITNTKNRLYIDPTNGLKLQKFDDPNWIDLFYVDENGDAFFEGTVAIGGIGGWTVETDYLAKDTGTDNTSAGMAPLDYPFYAGSTYANRATAPFRVTPAGAMTATSGKIANWDIGSTYLKRDGSTDAESAGMSPTDFPFYAGKKYADRDKANFRVTPTGKVYALDLYLDDNQLSFNKIDFDTITGKTISAVTISGSTINWANVSMYSSGNGVANIDAATTIALFVGDVGFEANTTSAIISGGGGTVYVGISGDTVDIEGGVTQNVTISGTTLKFVNGVFQGT